MDSFVVKMIWQAILTVSLLVGAIAPVQAQTASLETVQVTSEQVDRLVRSLLSIQPLVDAVDRQLLAVGSQEEQQAIEQRFVRSAADIVVREGLSVELYAQLIQLANADPEFRQRVATQLDRIQSEQPAPTPQTGR